MNDEDVARGLAGEQDDSAHRGLVWHYTSAQGLLSILSGHTVWATAAEFLNDRQEVRLGGERIAERIAHLDGAHPVYTALAEQLRNRPLDTGGSSHFFILSASNAWDSLAMWRLYGGSQESYAIGLDPEQPLSVLAAPGTATTDGTGGGSGADSEGSPSVLLRRLPWAPVRYGRAEQDELIDTVVDALPEVLERASDLRGAQQPPDGGEWRPETLPAEHRRIFEDVIDDLTEALLLIKHEGFVDERETRLAFTAVPTGQDLIPGGLLRYRPSHYGIAPYLALTGGSRSSLVAEAPVPLPIRAVAVSPSPHGPVAERSVRALLASHGYGDAEVLRSAIPFRG